MAQKIYPNLKGKYIRYRTYTHSLFTYGKLVDCKDIPYSENYLLTIEDVISEKRSDLLIYVNLMSNKMPLHVSTYEIANLDIISERDYLRVASLAVKNEKLFKAISQTLKEVKPLPWS